MAAKHNGGWASMAVVGCLTGIVLMAERLPRGRYVVSMIAISVLLPAIVASLVGVSARRFPGSVNIPNRDYWLAAERREATADWLTGHATWLAALLALLAFGVHLLVMRAHLHTPPSLAAGPFLGLLGGFTAALGLWLYALTRRFRRLEA
jgi:hypothetical protein